jgi:peroxiredoxin
MKNPSQSDTEVLAVAVDSKPDLAKMSGAVSRADGTLPGFLFLSDAGHRVINRYGILNQRSEGLPHPATYVIDKKGIVRWKFVEVDYRVRPTNQQILGALEALH